MIKILCESNEQWAEYEKTLPKKEYTDTNAQILSILGEVEKYLHKGDCDPEGLFSNPIERCLEIVRENQI